MWSLRLKQDGSFFLTYDKDRRFINNSRGVWDLIGPKDSAQTQHCVEVNRRAGLLCCDDEQGNVRVLVLEGK